MESKLAALLAPLFPSLDDALVSYLAGVGAEGGACAKWKGGADAWDALGEMLESYEAVADAKEGKQKCEQLYAQMVEKGMIKGVKPVAAAAAVAPAPAAKPAPSPAAAPTAKSAAASSSPPLPGPSPSPPLPITAAALPPIGSTCLARYSGDGQFYRARVVSVRSVPVVRIRVRFTGYGDEEEEVAPSACKDMQPPKGKDKNGESGAGDDSSDDEEDSSEEDDEGDHEPIRNAKLLNNPVQIGDIEPSRAARAAAEAAALAALEANGQVRELTTREQKALRKRQLKAERLAREAVAKATWVADTHKKAVQTTALPLYLQSQHLAKKALTKDIAIEDLTLLAPDNTELLSQTELRLVHGRRYGLLGRNGIGKSTLLRAMSTYSLRGFPTWLKIMHVEQECTPEALSVIDVVIGADMERTLLLQEEASLNAKLKELENMAAPAAEAVTASGDAPAASTTSSSSSSSTSSSSDSIASISDRLAAIYDRLQEIDSSTAHARASTILAGLQFSPQMQAMPTAALSGGWRQRVSLACALFVQPDLLLLDEPTNHLDYPAVLWLESYLQSYTKSVVVVSHDRTFLNSVVTDVIYFSNRKRLEQYRGDYANFIRVRAEKYKNDKRAYEAQQLQRQHLIDFITTFKTEKKSAAQDRKVGQAMSKQKQLDKMVLLENPDEESTDRFSLRFPDPEGLRLPLIAELKGVHFRYPKRKIDALVGAVGTGGAASGATTHLASAIATDASAAVASVAPAVLQDSGQMLLEDISVRVELSSRIGVLGANGCGKSTLLKLLLGDLQPVEGLVWLNPNVRIGYFTQHHIDQLNLGLTPVQWLKELFPGTPEVECRRHLGRFGLMGELALLQIGHLSGGQRSRLAFAIICWRQPHMLILDEPTNHLDLETIDVLIGAVNAFAGAVLVISHDQHFLQGCVREFWSIHQHRIKTFESLDACRKATYKIQAGAAAAAAR